MDNVRESVTAVCAALVLLGGSCGPTVQFGDPGQAVRCEGLVAVGTSPARDRVVVAFRNTSGRTILSFRARYEILDDFGEPIAGIDFACGPGTVRKLDSGDEVPFVFEAEELALVNYVRFGRERLPDRVFVDTPAQLDRALRSGALVPGASGVKQGWSVSEATFADGTVVRLRP